MIIQWMDKWGFEKKEKKAICNKNEEACNVFVLLCDCN
jgi:hypothetical protein